MKIKSDIISICILGCVFAGCQKDNYAPPKSKFQGALIYQGDSVRVSYNDVSFQLWQAGFGKLTPIDVTVDQDGSFSALLFDGNYKLIIQPGQGPFVTLTDPKTNSDTMLVQVNGDQTLNIEVLPYYMIRNFGFSVNNRMVHAKCSLEKIITDSQAKDIQSISLYTGKTQFVDRRTSIATATINGSNITDMNSITLSKEIPKMTPAQNYVFARIGVKIKGVEDMIFSPVVQLNL